MPRSIKLISVAAGAAYLLYMGFYFGHVSALGGLSFGAASLGVLSGLGWAAVGLPVVVWARARSRTVDEVDRSRGGVYRGESPVLAAAPASIPESITEQIHHRPAPVSHRRGRPAGLPSADHAAGFMRGLLADEEDLGDPPLWEGREAT